MAITVLRIKQVVRPIYVRLLKETRKGPTLAVFTGDGEFANVADDEKRAANSDGARQSTLVKGTDPAGFVRFAQRRGCGCVSRPGEIALHHRLGGIDRMRRPRGERSRQRAPDDARRQVAQFRLTRLDLVRQHRSETEIPGGIDAFSRRARHRPAPHLPEASLFNNRAHRTRRTQAHFLLLDNREVHRRVQRRRQRPSRHGAPDLLRIRHPTRTTGNGALNRTVNTHLRRGNRRQRRRVGEHASVPPPDALWKRASILHANLKRNQRHYEE